MCTRLRHVSSSAVSARRSPPAPDPALPLWPPSPPGKRNRPSGCTLPVAHKRSAGTNRSTSEVTPNSSAAANFSFKMDFSMQANLAKPRIKPPALQPGDTVGIVAPASNIQRSLLEAGAEALRKLGYRPVYSDSLLDRDLYFAGSIDRRVRELEE